MNDKKVDIIIVWTKRFGTVIIKMVMTMYVEGKNEGGRTNKW